MKNRLVILSTFSILLIVYLSCSGSSGSSTIGTDSKYDTQIYEVFGMDCPGCQTALNKVIRKIDGVIDSEASWVEKRLVIMLKPGSKLNEEDVFKAIRTANFTPGKRLK